MMLRSWLFIPADSDKKLGKIDTTPADAFLLDLEDSVTPERKPLAREMVAAFLSARPRDSRRQQLWVRINPLDTALALADLAAIMPSGPDGIMLPKAAGPEDVQQLSHYLDAFEVAAGLDQGSTKIIPLVSETAVAALGIGAYANASLPRVQALTWGAEDLSTALSATANRTENGDWDFTYQMVRSQTLLASHAMGVQAVDTLYVDFRDPDGLAASCRTSRREGFSGRLAIHPAQVEIINSSFLPSLDEVRLAEKIVDAFERQPDLGTIGIDGKMYDIPHLKQARRTLETFRAHAKQVDYRP